MGVLKGLNWLQRRRLNRALLIAVSKGETQQVKWLLDSGASANAEAWRATALGTAGRSPWGNAATVRLLLERGAFINGDPRRRRTQNPLVQASHQSDSDRIRLLITHGANVNALQPGLGTGLTPLQELVKWADLDTLNLLLERGADINKRCATYAKRMRGGFTALHSAASAGRPDVVAFLLEKGADIILSDAQGRTALDSARRTLEQPFFRNKKNETWAEAYRETIALLEKETERCPNH